MLPRLALFVGCLFIWWLFRMDMRSRQLPSRALWVPAIWLAQSSSRAIGFWLAEIGIWSGGASNLEGNSINTIFNCTLFVIAIVIANRKGFDWGRFVTSNKALFAVFFFFLFSMLWSQFPFPTLKRLVQEFGSVLMVPIFLTENDPRVSFRVVFARVSYVLFPLSVVLMRYFPHIGRNISAVSGTQMVCGVADHKNSLGQLAMVFCLIILWDYFESKKDGTAPTGKWERRARFINFGIGIYLLLVSASATAMMCFLVGIILFFVAPLLARVRNAKLLFMLCAALIVGALLLNQKVGISTEISMAMGRGEKISGRKEIWDKILEKETNPLVGHGFRGFWETAEGLSVAEELHTNRLVSSHNGYLEIYLQGGYIGLVLLLVFLFTTGVNAADKLVGGDPIGRLAILFWPILMVYNATESAYFQVGTLWFTMLIVTLHNPWQNKFAGQQNTESKEDPVLRSIQDSVGQGSLRVG